MVTRVRRPSDFGSRSRVTTPMPAGRNLTSSTTRRSVSTSTSFDESSMSTPGAPTVWWKRAPTEGQLSSTARIRFEPTTQSAYARASIDTTNTAAGEQRSRDGSSTSGNPLRRARERNVGCEDGDRRLGHDASDIASYPGPTVVQDRGAGGVGARPAVDAAPPGWADAEARNSDRTGVSARPSPGTGRNTNCWCSCAVPALRAPPSKFAFSASNDEGVSTWRPRTSAEIRHVRFDRRLDAFDEIVERSRIARNRCTGWMGDMGVRPCGFFALWLSRRVGHLLLPDDEERLAGSCRRPFPPSYGERVDALGQVNGSPTSPRPRRTMGSARRGSSRP